jgi:hypothetical protein
MYMSSVSRPESAEFISVCGGFHSDNLVWCHGNAGYKSILLVSQIPVNAWYDIFSDHTYAEASLACVLNESYRLEMNGKNMRNFEPINKRKNG